jgi:hypothetical protein
MSEATNACRAGAQLATTQKVMINRKKVIIKRKNKPACRAGAQLDATHITAALPSCSGCGDHTV